MGMIEELNSRSEEALLGLIGLEIVDAEDYISSRLELREELLAPNGYLRAATIVALADTSRGYGTFANLPEGAPSFTTIELKSNFLGTAREGTIECEEVWDAAVTGQEKTIALFRCTQMILYPR